tara:strand:+ start:112 stop:285 length:174 start_codon:yes stop_codon:yes gene_type:complete
MTDFTSWMTGGGAAVMAVGLSIKSYLTKRKEESARIILLETAIEVIKVEIKHLKEKS